MKSNSELAVKTAKSNLFRKLFGLSMFYQTFFGYDIFISYSRADAANYALNLANELTEKGYSCYLDQLITSPNEELPDELIKTLKYSSTFTLLGTKGAIASRFVGEELDEFLKTRRPIVIIDFGKAIEDADWKAKLKGLPMTPETNEALIQSKPSASVINRFVYPKKIRRLKIGLYISMTITILIAVAATYYSSTVTAKANKQVAEANEKANTAIKKADDALTALDKAEKNLDIANTELNKKKAISSAVSNEIDRKMVDGKRAGR